MTRSRRQGGGSAPVRLLAVVLVGVVSLLGGCATSSGTGTDDDAPAASSSSAPAASSSPVQPSQERTVEPSQARRVGSLEPEAPTQVRLPGTGFLPVSAVGTSGDGLLDVPPDVDRLGWWEGGARVGDPFGSILVAGHVDSVTEGLGPSATLLTIRRGERIAVRTESRRTTWAVRSRRLVPLDDLASYPGVLSSSGPARLTLVTCAPPFLPDAGGYQNLTVVTARPLAGTGR